MRVGLELSCAFAAVDHNAWLTHQKERKIVFKKTFLKQFQKTNKCLEMTDSSFDCIILTFIKCILRSLSQFRNLVMLSGVAR